MSLKAARRRHRETPAGRRQNAEAQARHRSRQKAAQQIVMDQGLDAAAGLGRVEVDVAAIDMGSIPAASGDLTHDIEEEQQHPEHPAGELAGAPSLGIETTPVALRECPPPDTSGAEEAGPVAAGEDEGGEPGIHPSTASCCVRCGREHGGWIDSRERRWNGRQRAPWRIGRSPDSS